MVATVGRTAAVGRTVRVREAVEAVVRVAAGKEVRKADSVGEVDRG